MFRFPTFLIVCLGLAGCSPQQGDTLSAGVSAPSAGIVGSSTYSANTQSAPVAEVEPAPIAQVATNDRRASRTPLPPRRPEAVAAETKAAPVATAREQALQVAQNQPIAQVQPITHVQPIAQTRSIAQSRAPAPVQPAAQNQTTVTASAAEPEAPSGVFSFARAFAAPSEPAPIPVVTRAEPAPERLPVVRAAFTPGAGTRFDPSRRAYGYAPPEQEDEGLQMTTRPGFEKTTPRVSEPGQRYYAAYSNTEVSCFPQRLREALNTIAKHYGQEVEVTSGMRHNGRRGSYHRRCMAADIRVPGVGPGALATFAKTIDGVNGVGTYRHNRVTHIDIRDYQMSWRY